MRKRITTIGHVLWENTIDKIFSRLLTIIVGVAIGATVSTFATASPISLSDVTSFFLAGAVLVLTGNLVAILQDIQKAMHEKVKARYEEDHKWSDERIKFYETLHEYVEKAESEILAISSIISSSKNFGNRETVARETYWNSFTKMLKSRQNQGAKFTYTRYYQVTKKEYDDMAREQRGDLIKSYGMPILASTFELLELNDDSENNNCTYEFAIIPVKHNYGFILIDRKIVIFIMDSVDNEGNPYQVGLFIVENSEDSYDVVEKKFQNYKPDATFLKPNYFSPSTIKLIKDYENEKVKK